mgnify:CR=1 FL=1
MLLWCLWQEGGRGASHLTRLLVAGYVCSLVAGNMPVLLLHCCRLQLACSVFKLICSLLAVSAMHALSVFFLLASMPCRRSCTSGY